MKNYEGKTLNQSMFRNSPVWFTIAVLLFLSAITNMGDQSLATETLATENAFSSEGNNALLITISLSWLFLWWLATRATRLCFNEKSVSLEKGILSKSQNEVFYSDIRNVRISQSFFNRIFNVGKIEISTAGQSDIEISVKGISNPNDIKKFLNSKRNY